jgi:hypothetical protein
MINLKGKIVFNTTNANILVSVPNTVTKNNVSASLNSVIDNEKRESLFILGSSRLDGNYKLSNDISNYFYSQQVADTLGRIKEISFNITASQCDFVFIEFDTANDYHPKVIRVDDVPYYDIKAFNCLWIDKEKSPRHTIRFDTWTPNAPVVIRAISTNLNIENPYEVSISHIDRTDEDNISWGIKDNEGKITFNDSYDVLSLPEEKHLIVGKKIELYLRSKHNTQKIADFDISKFQKKNNEKSEIGFNDLLYLQKLSFPLIWMQDNMSLYDFLMLSKQETSKITIEFSEGAQDALKNIYLTNPYYIDQELFWWGFFDQISQIAGLYISSNSNGGVLIHYGGGR